MTSFKVLWKQGYDYPFDGTLQACYTYDAWGNHRVSIADGTEIYNSNTGVSAGYEGHIGNINPYRYRGYYYDPETGLYYCLSRYYDPEVARWINADDVSYMDPETINGLNLYSYCGNNPLMYIDPSGHWKMPDWLKWIVGGVALVGAVVITAVTGGAIAPVLIGAGVSIVAGGLIQGTISAVQDGNFWDGFGAGAADGALWGGVLALGGATFGAIKYVTKGFQGAVQGSTKLVTITKGQKFDRFGSLFGKFITDVGTPASKLALPSINTGTKITLQATRNFRVFTGVVADAFGGTGGGIQYVMRYSIKTLIKKGWLIIV